MAAVTGILLAYVSAWALSRYVFETPFTPAFMPVLIVFLAICAITVIIGLMNIRSIVNRSPLEILRGDN
jgi:putative ABC transport system permease protein